MSNLQHRFLPAGTSATFPTSGEVHACKPAGCNSFRSSPQTNLRVATVFDFKRTRKCGKRRVCLDTSTRMSDLQCSFDPARTVAAFPTSSHQISAQMSDLQGSFSPAETDAAFPTSAESPFSKPEVRLTFSTPVLTNPQFTAVSGPFWPRKLLRPAGLLEPRHESCCDLRVCWNRGSKTVVTRRFAERNSQKLLQT